MRYHSLCPLPSDIVKTSPHKRESTFFGVREATTGNAPSGAGYTDSRNNRKFHVTEDWQPLNEAKRRTKKGKIYTRVKFNVTSAGKLFRKIGYRGCKAAKCENRNEKQPDPPSIISFTSFFPPAWARSPPPYSIAAREKIPLVHRVGLLQFADAQDLWPLILLSSWLFCYAEDAFNLPASM